LFAAEGAENGLEFTIVRPFNWIGPRMDFIPGIDGPSEGVPRVLACFSNVCTYLLGILEMLLMYLVSIHVVIISCFFLLQNLLRREPLKLVDGGESQRTFVYIKDAIDAVMLMIVSFETFLLY
jgi:UDP-apiose/xylose synthase